MLKPYGNTTKQYNKSHTKRTISNICNSVRTPSISDIFVNNFVRSQLLTIPNRKTLMDN